MLKLIKMNNSNVKYKMVVFLYNMYMQINNKYQLYNQGIRYTYILELEQSFDYN